MLKTPWKPAMSTQSPAPSTRSFQFLAAFLLVFKKINSFCLTPLSTPHPCLLGPINIHVIILLKDPRKADSTLPARQAHFLSRSYHCDCPVNPQGAQSMGPCMQAGCPAPPYPWPPLAASACSGLCQAHTQSSLEEE